MEGEHAGKDRWRAQKVITRHATHSLVHTRHVCSGKSAQIAGSWQFGIYRSVSSVKAWWAKFTAYAIANRLVRSRPAEYPTTHGSSPHL